jgi:hypothetical protein
MEYIIEGFKRLWAKPTDEVEGYHLMSDNKQNKSLIFVKDSDKCWRTKWLDNKIKVNTPAEPLQSLFKQ